MKKILALVIVFTIVIGSCFAVQSVEGCTISAENVDVKAGSSFSAVVNLSNNTGLAALSLAVEYDDSLMELASVVNGVVFADNALSTSSNSLENPYKVNWVNVDLSDSTSDGKLVDLNFNVFSDCESISSVVNLKVLQAFNSNMDDVAVNTSNINVNIKGSDKKVKGISVTPPKKTDYMINESLDTTGMVVTALYSDGSTSDVTEKSEIKSLDSSKSGKKLVVVSYKGFSTAFAVNVKASENILYLKPQEVKAVLGETVEIPLEVLNNPGICGVEAKINFDSNVFSLQSVANGNIFESKHMTLGGNKSKSPYNVFWENAVASKDYINLGSLGTVSLKINESAGKGTYPIGLILDNAVDRDLNSVVSSDTQVMISVYSRKYLFADATGDGRVNIKDSTAIQKQLSGFEVTIDEIAADCEADGVLSILDATKIQKMTTSLITDENFGSYIYA